MRKHRAARCALVNYVHARCYLPPDSRIIPCPGTVANKQEVARTTVGDVSGLAQAVKRNRPVVMTGLDLPIECTAAGDLLGHMRSLCGHRKVRVRLPPAGVADGAVTFGDVRRRSLYSRLDVWRFYRVVDEVLASAAASVEGTPRPMKCYAANLSIDQLLPELAAHLLPLTEIIEGAACGTSSSPMGARIPGTPVLYIGAGMQRTPMHFDPTENLTCMLLGTKTFRLFPPWASAQLKPNGGFVAASACWWTGVVPAVYSGIDPWTLDEMEGPTPIDVTLRTGEVLYLPTAWWHGVSGSAEPNVTVVFGFEPCE